MREPKCSTEQNQLFPVVRYREEWPGTFSKRVPVSCRAPASIRGVFYCRNSANVKSHFRERWNVHAAGSFCAAKHEAGIEAVALGERGAVDGIGKKSGVFVNIFHVTNNVIQTSVARVLPVREFLCGFLMFENPDRFACSITWVLVPSENAEAVHAGLVKF